MSTGRPQVESTGHAVSLPQGTEMLATFLSLMPDAAVAVGPEGLIVAVNERTEAFFGYTAEELRGKPIELLVPERYRHAHRHHRAGYADAPHARPMGVDLDLYARRKNGSEFPVDISLAPIGDAETPLVVAAVRDITERKAAQSAQAQLAAIVESSADGIFSITRAGVITSWNPGAETIFGLSRERTVGHHMSDFFPEDPLFEELIGTAHEKSRAAPARDTRWPRAGGELIDIAVSVSALAVGSEPGFSVLVRDVTARKAAEVELKHQAQWQEATAEIRLNMLSDAPLATSLTLVCKWAGELLDACSSALVVSDKDGTRVAATAGPPADVGVLASLTTFPQLVADAIATGTVQEGPMAALPGRQALAFPIGFSASSQRTGALVMIAAGPEGWAHRRVDVLQSLGASALLAFELATVRAERDVLLISADRERIARDLHDLVIQRLFGAGLRLQGAMALIDNEAAAARVSSTVNDLDTTIREIREAIFALESSPGAGLQAKLNETVAAAAEALGFRPVLEFRGQPGREVPLQVQIEAAAVLREALANAARHSQASSVEVTVVLGDDLTMSVDDNGVGMGQPSRFSGIANARARAELLGGGLQVAARPGGGTHFQWGVPLAGKRTELSRAQA